MSVDPVSTIQFSSVQDGIYALGKAHMHSAPSLGSFLNIAFETVPMLVWLMMALSRPLKEELRWALPLCTPLSSFPTPCFAWVLCLQLSLIGVSGEPDGVVESNCDVRPRDQHQESTAGKLQGQTEVFMCVCVCVFYVMENKLCCSVWVWKTLKRDVWGGDDDNWQRCVQIMIMWDGACMRKLGRVLIMLCEFAKLCYTWRCLFYPPVMFSSIL